MGCWIETCAVTRVPVFAGDPVVMVVLSEAAVKYGLQGPYNWPPHRGCERIETGDYDEYGWVKGVPHPPAGDHSHKRSIFIHREVWDRLISGEHYRDSVEDVDMYRHIAAKSPEAAKELDSEGDWITRPPAYWERLTEWVSVLRFCFECRVDLRGGLEFKGCQHDEPVVFDTLRDLTDDCYKKWFEQTLDRKE